MPEDEQGQEKETQNAEGSSLDTGNETSKSDESGDDQNTLAEKLGDKEVQGEIDRRVASALKKADQKREKAVEDALTKARRESEEAKLLEDGKTQELYELEREKRESAEAKLESIEREAMVRALLDKREVTDPRMRDLFLKLGGDLTDLNDLIDGVQVAMDEQVAAQVNDRLKTKPPIKPTDDAAQKLDANATLQEQLGAAQKEAIKTHDWTAYKRIASEIQDSYAKAGVTNG